MLIALGLFLVLIFENVLPGSLASAHTEGAFDDEGTGREGGGDANALEGLAGSDETEGSRLRAGVDRRDVALLLPRFLTPS